MNEFHIFLSLLYSYFYALIVNVMTVFSAVNTFEKSIKINAYVFPVITDSR